MTLRFGIQNPQWQTWPEMVERWRRCEELGFDSLWIPDHLVPPFNPEGPLLEAWSVLAGMAGITSRARLGVLVSCNTFRPPALLAKMAATLDQMSNGRLELGIGAGWFEPEHRMFGIPLPEKKELVDRFRESVEIVDLLLRSDGTPVSYDGTYHRLADAPFRPAPVQRPRPPLVLGAHGPRMMRVVARYAETWSTVGVVAELRPKLASLEAACAEVGRDPATIVRSVLYVPPQMPSERPWDSLAAFVDYVGRYRELGMTEFVFQPPQEPERFALVERVAADVLPGLRAG
jgi:alkanesulfonate monooxygenase SsuD/methylene tetrahydromethanopterin reductase-like flavin-dependent oxidoreductase (luciferase family)